MAVRLKGSYNHHYSDLISDSGIPIGTICSVFVDDGSSSTPTSSSVADNYPGWLYCDGSQLSVEDYPLLFEVIGNKYGGTNPANVQLRDWGSSSGTTSTAVFNLPDLRMKRLNGPGGVDGPGSITPDNSQMQVGDTGGEWFISRARQLNEYTIGAVRVQGYENCIDFIDGSLSGNTSYTVGPLQTKLLTGAPPHTHLLLCSEEDLRDGMDNGAAHNDNEYSPNYNGTFGSVVQFDPTGGSPAEHTHYIAEFNPNTTGPNIQYSYCTSSIYPSENGILTFTDNGAADGSRTPGVYNVNNVSGSGTGVLANFVVDVASDGTPTVTLSSGGKDYAVNELLTIPDSSLGGGGAPAIIITVTTLTGADAYTNPYGANLVNNGSSNSRGQSVTFEEQFVIDVNPTEAGITLNTGTITMTGAEQISVVASIVPTTPVPLVLKYFRVKYLIKAW